MADTIVNAPQQTPQSSGVGGWIVAVLVLILVIVGGFVWYRYYRVAQPSTTNVNVTVPLPGASATTQ
jgi:hypothetical protein